MAEHAHQSHKKEYFIIFALLALFTVIELFIPEIKSWSRFAKGTGLTIVALVKAFLVAFYYMHLKEERAWIKFIAAIPISAAIYAYVVVLESMYR